MKLSQIYLFLLSILILGCFSKKNEKEFIEKEFAQGSKFAAPVIALFNSGELNKISSAFAAISKNPALTPTMKLEGYTYVYYSFERMNRFDSALMYQDSCINIIEQNHLEKILYSQYSGYLLSKSTALFNLHQPEKANAIFYKVKKEAEESDNIYSKHMIFERLGLIAYKQRNFKEALENFKKISYSQEQINAVDYYKKAEIIDNIGLCYFHLKQYDSALSAYHRGLQVLEKNAATLVPYISTKEGNIKPYNHSRGVLVGNIANLYNSIEQYDSAIEYSKQSILLNGEQDGERLDAQLVAVRLADIYIKLDKLSEAEKLMQQVKKGLDSLPDESVRMNWNRQMAIMLEKQNKPDKAFGYYKAFKTISDSLNALELKDAENNIVKDLQIKNQESDLSLLKKDNELSQLYIWISVGLIIVAIAIALLIFTNYKKGKKKNQQLTLLNEQITNQQKLTEQALQQLAVSNKQKDKILNVVAHDLRNPIGAIANFLKVIQLRYEHSEGEEKILKSTQQAAVHSLALINELLEVNRIKEGEILLNKTNIHLTELLKSVVEQLQHKAIEKQQNIEISMATQDIVLNADEEKLQRVISNLIDNAIKFSANNKTIEMAAQQDAEAVTIQIKDAGIGIPEDIINQLFTASITIKRSGTNNEKSNGLGLSICKQIVEAHSGTIEVKSEENIGTTFSIKLPKDI